MIAWQREFHAHRHQPCDLPRTGGGVAEMLLAGCGRFATLAGWRLPLN